MLRAALLTVVLLTMTAAPAHAFFGTNSQPLVKLSVASPDRWGSFFGAQARDGLSVSRSDALWSAVEPNAPQNGTHDYRWTNADPTKSMDGIVATMAAQGVRWAPVISTPPSWAGGNGRRVTPQRYPDLASFAAEVARRYGPGGAFWAANPQLPQLPIRDVQLWTEANSTHSWTGGPDAAEYVAGLRLVTPAVRMANPQVQVLVSLGWQDFEAFTDQLYANGAKGLMDGFGFHPYAAHAAAIIDLVQRMRTKLRQHGDGDLPIHVTEIGQPATYTGDGAVSATEGRIVSDRARGATHALVGEALARSDCGVTSYLLYALVGSETDREGGNEGYMGVYRLADATANETGAALRDAATRLRGPGGQLKLCSPDATPASALLPLELRTTATDARCTSGVITFHGRPLESAQLVLRAPGGQTAKGESNAYGQAQACFPAPVTGAVASAELGKAAATPGPGSGAPPSGDGGGKAATKTPATKRSCWRLEGKVLAAGRKSTRLRARIRCLGGATPRSTRIAVALQRKGAKTATTVRRVTLRGSKTLKFTAKVRLRRGDRLVLRFRPTAATRRAGGPPALTQRVAR